MKLLSGTGLVLKDGVQKEIRGSQSGAMQSHHLSVPTWTPSYSSLEIRKRI